jgi:hypothetical protein
MIQLRRSPRVQGWRSGSALNWNFAFVDNLIVGTCNSGWGAVLSRPNTRHIVMFAQAGEVAIQFLDALFVRFDAFAL